MVLDSKVYSYLYYLELYVIMNFIYRFMKLLTILLLAILLEGCVVAPVGRYHPSRGYYGVPRHLHHHHGRW